MFQPIDELFNQRVDAGAPGIQPDVGLLVSRATLMIQAFERPSAGTRSIRRSSGTSSQTETPSALIAARFWPSTNVPPPVATTRWRRGT